MAIQIITDSTSDITQDKGKELGITIVPLQVIFGEETYYDGIEIDSDGFFDKLTKSSHLPQTSQPSPETFVELFQKFKDAGDEIIVITISSKMSGTVQSAMIAKDMVKYDKIYIIDSLQVMATLQLLVYHAVELRDQGVSAAEIAKSVLEKREKVRIYVVIMDITYLKKGGRLTGASAIASSILHLNPIVSVIGGEVVAVGVGRGVNDTCKKIGKLIKADGGRDESMPYNVVYAGDPADAVPFEEALKNKLGYVGGSICQMGPVVGTHGGPGACAVGVFLS
ncbi:MAG: DegV family protein [Lachnospiraceae bacterium]